MIRNANRFASTFVLVSRLSLPLGVVAATFVTPACMFSSKGPSNVSQGKQYVSGDPTYDAFFDDLYKTQVALAQAPDRERVAREKLASAVNVGAAAAPQAIGEALDKRASELLKSGVALKLTVAGLDDPTATPTASLSSSGQPTAESDRSLIAQVTETASADAAVLGDMRKARVVIGRLRDQAETLEPNVDTAFKKQGLKKRSEVGKNMADAKRLMSLMSTRVEEVERSTVAMLHNMAQAAKHDAPPPPPPPPVEDDKDKKKKKKGGAPAAAPAGGGTASPAAPAAPKPAAPAGGAAAPKPASPDFEP